jgi:hypothetical protein
MLPVHIRPLLMILDLVNAAAWIQAASAVAIVLLTALLAWTTYRYAKATDEAVRLSRDQFEREWTPEVRVADVVILNRNPREASAKVANLSRQAVLIVGLRISKGDGDRQDIATYRRGDLISGGTFDNLTIHQELGAYRGRYYPVSQASELPSPLEARIQISLEYLWGGMKLTTDCFAFSVLYRGLDIVQVIPIA